MKDGKLWDSGKEEEVKIFHELPVLGDDSWDRVRRLGRKRRIIQATQTFVTAAFCSRERIYARCQDSSMVRFLRIDPMVSGSGPTSAKLSLRVRRASH